MAVLRTKASTCKILGDNPDQNQTIFGGFSFAEVKFALVIALFLNNEMNKGFFGGVVKVLLSTNYWFAKAEYRL